MPVPPKEWTIIEIRERIRELSKELGVSEEAYAERITGRYGPNYVEVIKDQYNPRTKTELDLVLRYFAGVRMGHQEQVELRMLAMGWATERGYLR